MRNKVLALIAAVSTLAIIAAIIFAGTQLPDDTAGTSAAAASAVQVQMPIDFTGTWKSIDTISPKMSAKISGDHIEIQLVSGKTKANYWYGTWANPTTKVNRITSTAIKNTDNLYLSSSHEKEFVYEGGKLTFDFTAGGVTTQVVMDRV